MYNHNWSWTVVTGAAQDDDVFDVPRMRVMTSNQLVFQNIQSRITTLCCIIYNWVWTVVTGAAQDEDKDVFNGLMMFLQCDLRQAIN